MFISKNKFQSSTIFYTVVEIIYTLDSNKIILIVNIIRLDSKLYKKHKNTTSVFRNCLDADLCAKHPWT